MPLQISDEGSLLTPKLDTPLVEVSIDEALSHIGKIDEKQFI
jgi:hypothetical protein